jgi:hypothetical protein
MIHTAASQSDPRLLAVEQGRLVLESQAFLSGSRPFLDTLVLRRKDGAEPTAFLISLWSGPVRLLAPLRVGENIVARQSDISDYDLILPDTLRMIPKHGWPIRWCEAGQCHIVCQPPDLARVADRATYGTFLYRSGSPPERLPMPDVQGSVVRYDAQGTGLEPVEGDWSSGACEGNAPRRGPWSQLFEGDVLVCLNGLWVFAWLPTSRSTSHVGA